MWPGTAFLYRQGDRLCTKPCTRVAFCHSLTLLKCFLLHLIFAFSYLTDSLLVLKDHNNLPHDTFINALQTIKKPNCDTATQFSCLVDRYPICRPLSQKPGHKSHGIIVGRYFPNAGWKRPPMLTFGHWA